MAALVDKGNAIEVTFEGDVPEKTKRFSRVLLSVGRRPNTSGIGLERTKTQVDQRGFIVVDPQRRTADPHLLAIGDVAGDPMLAHKARTRAKQPSRRWPANRPPSSREPFRPSCSPIPKSPGPA